MNPELTQEKIDHLQTKIALYQTQGQLISVLAQNAQVQMEALRAQLPKAEAPTNSKPKPNAQGQAAVAPADAN